MGLDSRIHISSPSSSCDIRRPNSIADSIAEESTYNTIDGPVYKDIIDKSSKNKTNLTEKMSTSHKHTTSSFSKKTGPRNFEMDGVVRQDEHSISSIQTIDYDQRLSKTSYLSMNGGET